jgi:hypothetical protein
VLQIIIHHPRRVEASEASPSPSRSPGKERAEQGRPFASFVHVDAATLLVGGLTRAQRPADTLYSFWSPQRVAIRGCCSRRGQVENASKTHPWKLREIRGATPVVLLAWSKLPLAIAVTRCPSTRLTGEGETVLGFF